MNDPQIGRRYLRHRLFFNRGRTARNYEGTMNLDCRSNSPPAASPPQIDASYMFTAAKDVLASKAAQTWANTLIARYGKVQEVKIDSRGKTLVVTCLLDGEPTSITIRITDYVVETDQNKKFIRATGFSCSRPWLHNFLTDFGPKQRIELPPWAAAVL
jgi:hypothetical protein